MAPPNNPNVVRAALIMARDTRQIINTMHIDQPGGWTLGDLTTLGAALKTWFDTYYKLLLPSAYSLNTIQLRVYNPAVPLALDYSVTPPIAGTRPGAAEAGNVSLTMSERTGLAGRKYRGRMYVAGVSETDVSATDTISSTVVALASNAMANLIVSALPGIASLNIFHRADNTTTEVISYVIENILDSQRRRLPGRGR